MKPRARLTSELKPKQDVALPSELRSEAQPVREFATAEELLRHDAAHTEVPSAIADRLQHSVASEPAPVRSWWKRILGGSTR